MAKSWVHIWDNARLDVWFETEKGRVTDFGVTLTYVEGEESYPVLRYDTAHGYIHKHIFWGLEERIEKRRFRGRNPGEVLNEALQDVDENWEKHIERFREAKGKRRDMNES